MYQITIHLGDHVEEIGTVVSAFAHPNPSDHPERHMIAEMVRDWATSYGDDEEK